MRWIRKDNLSWMSQKSENVKNIFALFEFCLWIPKNKCWRRRCMLKCNWCFMYFGKNMKISFLPEVIIYRKYYTYIRQYYIDFCYLFLPASGNYYQPYHFYIELLQTIGDLKRVTYISSISQRYLNTYDIE